MRISESLIKLEEMSKRMTDGVPKAVVEWVY
jgi:hypothetical protein